MAESGNIDTSLKVSPAVMKNHMITFLIQYIAAIQNIQDRQQLVWELMLAWEKKFNQSIGIVKKSMAQTYAEHLDEDEDVWDVILDATNMHVEDMVLRFSEEMRKMLLKNMKLI